MACVQGFFGFPFSLRQLFGAKMTRNYWPPAAQTTAEKIIGISINITLTFYYIMSFNLSLEKKRWKILDANPAKKKHKAGRPKKRLVGFAKKNAAMASIANPNVLTSKPLRKSIQPNLLILMFQDERRCHANLFQPHAEQDQTPSVVPRVNPPLSQSLTRHMFPTLIIKHITCQKYRN